VQQAPKLKRPITATAQADAGSCGIRLTVPVVAGSAASEIEIEPAHCERLFRMAAYRAIRDGRVRSGEALRARVLPGQVRDQHGSTRCLETCTVELLSGRRRRTRVEFRRDVFAAFATARALHLAAHGNQGGAMHIGYSLHGSDGADAPAQVAVPPLPSISIAALRARAAACGEPADEWIVTFMSAQVAAGLEAMANISRSSGVEAAARIHTRGGFDPERRCFVRFLDRLVISRATQATAVRVVSTAASWADFLDTASGDGPQAPASVHTHLHLRAEPEASDPPHSGPPPSDGMLSATQQPCISIDDLVTHYITFPDPLSAALIVSLFPDRQVVRLYGYAPDAQLSVEPGYWLLPAGAA
jgi:hypothetical protein